jgi:hypothetical protein
MTYFGLARPGQQLKSAIRQLEWGANVRITKAWQVITCPRSFLARK